MIFERLANQLKRHEGFKKDGAGFLIPYQDSVGIWTGGYGYNFQAHGVEPFSMSEQTAHNLLMVDIHDALQATRRLFPTYDSLTDDRQEVLVNMVFNMGETTVSTLISLRAAVTAGNWHLAKERMLSFKWARQVGKEKGQRAYELAEQMLTGTSTQPIPQEG